MQTFVSEAAVLGVKVQIFGASADNARAFWNWQFIPDLPELTQTRAMLMRACDVRLQVHLPADTLDKVGDVLLSAITASKGVKAA